MQDIIQDLNAIIKEKDVKLTGDMVRAILVIMLTNRYIWENESKAREGGNSQDKLLKLTHSINGVRNRAKNVVSREMKERVDLEIDAFAANLRLNLETGTFGTNGFKRKSTFRKLDSATAQ